VTAKRFSGRRALVTGASRGIGAAVALQLAHDGADVAIAARTVDPQEKIAGSLNETAAAIRELGVRCVVIGADLSDGEDRARVVPEALDGLGGLDILVNNAAMEVNYQAPADFMQALVPHFAQAGEGWIVNLTSGATRHVAGPPFVVLSDTGLYGATKAALDRLTNAMGASLHGSGIRVNAVMPRAGVLSEGAQILAGHLLRPDQIEPMESMIESVLILCACAADRTGRVYVSLDLLDEFAQLSPAEGA
jgi:citronellol/citronellal dehydrogenase